MEVRLGSVYLFFLQLHLQVLWTDDIVLKLTFLLDNHFPTFCLCL